MEFAPTDNAESLQGVIFLRACPKLFGRQIVIPVLLDHSIHELFCFHNDLIGSKQTDAARGGVKCDHVIKLRVVYTVCGGRNINFGSSLYELGIDSLSLGDFPQ